MPSAQQSARALAQHRLVHPAEDYAQSEATDQQYATDEEEFTDNKHLFQEQQRKTKRRTRTNLSAAPSPTPLSLPLDGPQHFRNAALKSTRKRKAKPSIEAVPEGGLRLSVHCQQVPRSAQSISSCFRTCGLATAELFSFGASCPAFCFFCISSK
ncbi:hypothetical protein JCM11641_004359 [Rhodosporidiobolus odoratus]